MKRLGGYRRQTKKTREKVLKSCLLLNVRLVNINEKICPSLWWNKIQMLRDINFKCIMMVSSSLYSVCCCRHEADNNKIMQHSYIPPFRWCYNEIPFSQLFPSRLESGAKFPSKVMMLLNSKIDYCLTRKRLNVMLNNSRNKKQFRFVISSYQPKHS